MRAIIEHDSPRATKQNKVWFCAPRTAKAFVGESDFHYDFEFRRREWRPHYDTACRHLAAAQPVRARLRLQRGALDADRQVGRPFAGCSIPHALGGRVNGRGILLCQAQNDLIPEVFRHARDVARRLRHVAIAIVAIVAIIVEGAL